MLKIKNRHHGIGLLELMLSLAIIAAVILLATRYFSQASEASKVTQATQIIRTLTDASFKWVEGKPNFDGEPGKNNPLSIPQLITDGILSSDWSDKPSPWGEGKGTSTITLEPYSSGMLMMNRNQIKITILNVPESACKSINDIMIKQGVKECPCNNGTYVAIYPKDDPYNPQG